jgi:diguanylate cyclase (GGDEF)-like protein
VVTFVAASHFDAFDHFVSYAAAHEEYELDEVAMLSVTLSLCLGAFAVRRLVEQRRELRLRLMAEASARQMAFYDALTGLPNRRNFEHALKMVLAQGEGSDRLAVMMLDLDNFKPVNDVHGHAVGDDLLRAFANRLKSSLPASAIAARFGGDEFAVLATLSGGPQEAVAIADAIISSLAEPFQLGAATSVLGVSIGISSVGGGGAESGELVRRADVALYRAKAHGRSAVAFFEPEMDLAAHQRSRLLSDVRIALRAGAFEPWFQPLVDLNTGSVIGFEALARWAHPERGNVSPDEFIPLLEAHGLIAEFSDQMLRKACQAASTWPKELFLSFNMSPIQLRNGGAALTIISILSETRLPPQRLEIEITESALVEDMGTAKAVVVALREAGIRISLDDFGTGYSGLYHLRELKIDKIKIDRSFIKMLASSDEAKTIVRAMLALSGGLGLLTTAEGIEQEDQRLELLADGCEQGQGWLFGKAVPASEVPALLRRTAPIRSAAA